MKADRLEKMVRGFLLGAKETYQECTDAEGWFDNKSIGLAVAYCTGVYDTLDGLFDENTIDKAPWIAVCRKLWVLRSSSCELLAMMQPYALGGSLSESGLDWVKEGPWRVTENLSDGVLHLE